MTQKGHILWGPRLAAPNSSTLPGQMPSQVPEQRSGGQPKRDGVKGAVEGKEEGTAQQLHFLLLRGDYVGRAKIPPVCLGKKWGRLVAFALPLRPACALLLQGLCVGIHRVGKGSPSLLRATLGWHPGQSRAEEARTPLQWATEALELAGVYWPLPGRLLCTCSELPVAEPFADVNSSSPERGANSAISHPRLPGLLAPAWSPGSSQGRLGDDRRSASNHGGWKGGEEAEAFVHLERPSSLYRFLRSGPTELLRSPRTEALSGRRRRLEALTDRAPRGRAGVLLARGASGLLRRPLHRRLREAVAPGGSLPPGQAGLDSADSGFSARSRGGAAGPNWLGSPGGGAASAARTAPSPPPPAFCSPLEPAAPGWGSRVAGASASCRGPRGRTLAKQPRWAGRSAALYPEQIPGPFYWPACGAAVPVPDEDRGGREGARSSFPASMKNPLADLSAYSGIKTRVLPTPSLVSQTLHSPGRWGPTRVAC